MSYPIDKLILSHSTRSTARSCMRKLEFAKMYGDSPVFRDESFPGSVGNALHAGFQAYLAHAELDPRARENHAMMALLTNFPHDMEYQASENSSRSLEACYATLAEMLRHPMVDRYELVHIKTKTGDVRPAIEVPFAFEILGTPSKIPVFFVGFIDAILRDRAVDRYIVDDIKTTRQYISDISARYEYDEQTVPYGIVLEHILGRTIDQFDVSYFSAFIDLMEPKIGLYPFTKTREHVHDWMRGLYDDIARISRYIDASWFPRATNGDTCMAFKRPCFFAEYCAFRDPELIARMLQATPRVGLFQKGRDGKEIEPWMSATLDLSEFAI